MKKILLTQDKYALVDDEDFERVNQYKWCFDNGYAHRKLSNNKKIYMHRFIFNTLEGFDTDHINRNGLDNRKENLRGCSHRDNLRNKKTPSHNSSGYKGVSWSKDHKKWRANIKIDGKQRHLGYFVSILEAKKVYDKFAKQYFGEFARVN